jgi:hypothetical protein
VKTVINLVPQTLRVCTKCLRKLKNTTTIVAGKMKQITTTVVLENKKPETVSVKAEKAQEAKNPKVVKVKTMTIEELIKESKPKEEEKPNTRMAKAKIPAKKAKKK